MARKSSCVSFAALLAAARAMCPTLWRVSSRTGPFRRCAWKLRAARRCPPLPLLIRLACLEQALLRPSRVCLAQMLLILLCALMVRA